MSVTAMEAPAAVRRGEEGLLWAGAGGGVEFKVLGAGGRGAW
ncbi:MAG: hypothetical protein OXC00_16625 [Acidimicrobiaceae bacterium]|nr:hypothetical protein [Acidimicrobiaceae bacterium]